MFLGLMTTAVGTQLHFSDEKELETILKLSNDFIGAQSAAAAWSACSCQLCLSEAFYSPSGKDVRLAESCG